MTLFEKRAREEVAFWEKFIEDWRTGMGGDPPERMREALAWARQRLAGLESSRDGDPFEPPACREVPGTDGRA